MAEKTENKEQDKLKEESETTEEAEKHEHKHETFKKLEEKAEGRKIEENKIILEREYIVPLREELRKVPEYKRANKAVKALKQFIARHMKIYDRDLRKVKIDVYLNNELRFRGIKKPIAKIKIKAIKRENGIVEAKLAELPKHIEFEIARKARKEAERENKKEKIDEAKKEEEKTEAAAGKPEESREKIKEDIEKKEKENSSREAIQELEKSQAKQAKHLAGAKKAMIIHRKALQK